VRPKTTFRGAVVRRPPGAPVAPGAVPHPGASHPPQHATPGSQNARVRVGREVAGRGGKAVSVVAGLPLTGAQLEALATRLKKLCGAGGAVKEGVIEIQGDHRDRIVTELQRLGFQAKRSGG